MAGNGQRFEVDIECGNSSGKEEWKWGERAIVAAGTLNLREI